MRDAVVNACEYCGGGEIGVGIGTANAVFDMPTDCWAAGHTERHSPIVDAPTFGQRRVTAGLEPAI